MEVMCVPPFETPKDMPGPVQDPSLGTIPPDEVGVGVGVRVGVGVSGFMLDVLQKNPADVARQPD